MFSARSALVALASLALVAASPVGKRQSAAGPHAGRAAFYSVGLGICGKFSQPSDFVTAVSPEVFNAFPGATPGQTFGNPICGKQATVSYHRALAAQLLFSLSSSSLQFVAPCLRSLEMITSDYSAET